MSRGPDYTSEADVRALYEAQGNVCGKPGCATPIHLEKPRDFIIEHLTALGRKGSNELRNKALYCIPCAKAKTHGTGATTYGSDIHEIAKERRLKRTGKMEVHKPEIGEEKEQKPKSRFAGSKASGWRKKMDGTAERR